MKKFLILFMITPLTLHAGLTSDNTLILADCNASQTNSTVKSYCNGTTYCVTSSATMLPHTSNTSYKVFQYCTVKSITVDAITHKLLLCFKDENQCYGMRSCNSGYKGTTPTLNATNSVGLVGAGITNVNTNYWCTYSISNINQFKCCYTTSGHASPTKPSAMATSNASYYAALTCSTTGTTTNTGANSYVSCDAGYYSATGKASVTIASASTNPANVVGQLSCTACPAGYYGATSGLTTSTCSGKCASGKYSTGGATSCSTCTNKPTNSAYTSATGNTSSACPWTCNQGYYGSSANNNTSCANCGAGYYCTGGTNKTKCPAGTDGSGTNNKGNVCNGKCPVGKYSGEGNTGCIACPSPENGGTATTSATGSTSATNCYVAATSSGWKDANNNTYECTVNATYSN